MEILEPGLVQGMQIVLRGLHAVKKIHVENPKIGLATTLAPQVFEGGFRGDTRADDEFGFEAGPEAANLVRIVINETQGSLFH